MTSLNNLPAFELIYVIVNHGMGSKVLHKAKEYGVRGGTILLGKGTVRGSLLKFLSLYDERKEIVMLGADKKTAERAITELDKEFQFSKPHHGIVFSTSACSVLGSRCYTDKDIEEERGVERPMYQLITTIVNRGKAEDVITVANKAGSRGGTILNARGSGTHETTKIFNMEIEPEKEVVMILAKNDVSENIARSIREGLELDKPGNGIIFIQDVNAAYGLSE